VRRVSSAFSAAAANRRTGAFSLFSGHADAHLDSEGRGGPRVFKLHVRNSLRACDIASSFMGLVGRGRKRSLILASNGFFAGAWGIWNRFLASIGRRACTSSGFVSIVG
jgi:hypothetical protein